MTHAQLKLLNAARRVYLRYTPILSLSARFEQLSDDGRRRWFALAREQLYMNAKRYKS